MATDPITIATPCCLGGERRDKLGPTHHKEDQKMMPPPSPQEGPYPLQGDRRAGIDHQLTHWILIKTSPSPVVRHLGYSPVGKMQHAARPVEPHPHRCTTKGTRGHLEALNLAPRPSPAVEQNMSTCVFPPPPARPYLPPRMAIASSPALNSSRARVQVGNCHHIGRPGRVRDKGAASA
jgi:hypothetical protein